MSVTFKLTQLQSFPVRKETRGCNTKVRFTVLSIKSLVLFIAIDVLEHK